MTFHFPGAFGVGRVPTVQVVDGQQRLTTFQLFLAALRDVARSQDHTDVADRLEVYLVNDARGASGSEEDRLKLVPTPADKELFKQLLELPFEEIKARHRGCFFANGRPIKKECLRALWAYCLFREKIEDFCVWSTLIVNPEDLDTEKQHDTADRLRALADALLLHLKLVIITLEEGDDAQVIFETLNSRGEPLLAMDLVRNNIFHRAEAQGESAERLFHTKWSVFDGQFWKEPPARAKPQKPRIDFFLSHALTAQTGAETSLRELYAEYRAFSRPKGQPRFLTVAEELDALLRYVPSYRTLELHDGGSAIDLIGRRLALWEVTTAYPAVLCIAADSSASELEKERLYTLIYSYIVHRAICDLTPKNYNKTFQRLVTTFLKDGVSVVSFSRAFAEQQGPAVRFPDDGAFRSAIVSRPLYDQFAGKVTRLVDVLWELERASRDKFMVDTPRPASLSVEHIMPQAWQAHWPLSDGRVAPADKHTGADETMIAAIHERDRLIHTIGNLTLVTEALNPSLSNREFLAKKPKLRQGLLALNHAFDCETWDESGIQNRSKKLADVAVRVWPMLPGELVDQI